LISISILNSQRCSLNSDASGALQTAILTRIFHFSLLRVKYSPLESDLHPFALHARESPRVFYFRSVSGCWRRARGRRLSRWQIMSRFPLKKTLIQICEAALLSRRGKATTLAKVPFCEIKYAFNLGVTLNRRREPFSNTPAAAAAHDFAS
jgi:hypothetical protein